MIIHTTTWDNRGPAKELAIKTRRVVGVMSRQLTQCGILGDGVCHCAAVVSGQIRLTEAHTLKKSGDIRN